MTSHITANIIVDVDVTAALDGLWTDLHMLADGEWEPDRHSVDASIDMLEVLGKYMHHEFEDRRDIDD